MVIGFFKEGGVRGPGGGGGGGPPRVGGWGGGGVGGGGPMGEFDLKCVKAVQTIADQEDSRFQTWFDALDHMTEEVAKQDFDVALIGCGAYGFQLASRIKRMGKIAVHMGGSVQTLFGVKGGRWDKQYASMYNDAWVYPSESETPKGFEKVEGGCYWNPTKVQ